MSTFSPLQKVERAVQERAKAVSLDMGSPEAAVRLRALVGEEVARWSDDFKRSFDIADPEAGGRSGRRRSSTPPPTLPAGGPAKTVMTDLWDGAIDPEDRSGSASGPTGASPDGGSVPPKTSAPGRERWSTGSRADKARAKRKAAGAARHRHR